MAITIDATVGGSTSNSYVTLAEAVAYFEGRLNTAAWDVLTSDEAKNVALVSACRRIDQEEFSGVRSSLEQALAWPRWGASADGIRVDSQEIPQRVKNAQCELALFMLQSDLLADTGLEGFERVKVGPLEVTPRHGRRAGALPENVRRELAPFLVTPSSNSIRFMRG